jgi:hypothetical protein
VNLAKGKKNPANLLGRGVQSEARYLALDRRPRADNKEDDEKEADEAERLARRADGDVSSEEGSERAAKIPSRLHAVNPT